MVFKEELKKYQGIVNEYLEQYSKIEDKPERILDESCKYSLMAGGKRLRPILILATFKMFEEDIEECVPFMVAMEMIHNFSLIHDDLPAIDNDDFRHSKPTNHKVYGESTAILAGDRLLNSAYIVLSEKMKHTEKIDRYVNALNEIAVATNKMIAGEFVDIECENKKISDELLKYMHANKTGALIKASVRIGAILGGASKEQLECLTIYAEKIGLAFQIKDDILSEIGDEKITGKPVGNDEKLNKSTFVTMYGLDEAKNRLNEIINEAIDCLKLCDNTSFLEELAVYIKNRDH